MLLRLGCSVQYHIVALLVLSLPLTARCANGPVMHDSVAVYPAYQCAPSMHPGYWCGYADACESAFSYSGVLVIDPGPGWENFISAAQESVPFNLTEATLRRESPVVSGYEYMYPGSTVTQTGPADIRLTWPLQYEAPGTSWTLTIEYETSSPWDDDGDGPNEPSLTHSDVWVWRLEADVAHLQSLLELLHEVEVARSVAPVNDEVLYAALAAKLEQAGAYQDSGDYPAAANVLDEFVNAIQGARILMTPATPAPTGPGTGILDTPEHPAATKLMSDAAYVISHQPSATGGSTPGHPAVQASAVTRQASASTANTLYHSSSGPSAFTAESGSNPVKHRGFAGVESGEVGLANVLQIVPGDQWGNFIRARQQGVGYVVQDVSLAVRSPGLDFYTEMLPAYLVTQSGEANIRLWWPLMYETAGTTWTITIDYSTPEPWDDDGPGPNPPSTDHTEVWIWELVDYLYDVNALVDLFHRQPFGLSCVPLIGEDSVYGEFSERLQTAAMAYEYGDPVTAANLLLSVEWAASGLAISVAPPYPNPSGPGMGIPLTYENPASAKLATSIDYTRLALGIANSDRLDTFAGNLALRHSSSIYSARSGAVAGEPRLFAGYVSASQGDSVAPGVLEIDPGSDSWWSNFVMASQYMAPYTVTSVGLRMQAPSFELPTGSIPARRVSQVDTPSIRLRWPLAYELPGTTWTLTLVYKTPTMFDSDGWGPNPPGWLHAEEWVFRLDGNLYSLTSLLEMFRDVPVGVGSAPFISDEALYSRLRQYVQNARVCVMMNDLIGAAEQLSMFESEVTASAVASPPGDPGPTGGGTGIVESAENPAATRLLAEADYIRMVLELPDVPAPVVAPNARAAIGLASAKQGSGGATPGATITHATSYVPSASAAEWSDPWDGSTSFRGYLGPEALTPTLPGVLGISPGADWGNFVAAAQSGIPYSLQDVVLTKQAPGTSGYPQVFPARTVTQSGAENIRLWWPLMYEEPGTTFTLSLTYQTPMPHEFPGEKTAGTLHTETWRWRVCDDLTSLNSLLRLYHDLPFGCTDVPLVSDEPGFNQLDAELDYARQYLDGGDLTAMAESLDYFKTDVGDMAIALAPWFPSPTGPGTGIANTVENPACTKLLVSTGDAYPVQCGSTAELATNTPDTAVVELEEEVVATLVTPDWFYVQNPSRTSGLKVVGQVPGLQAGGRVLLKGIVTTEGPERVLQMVGYEVNQASGSLPGPLLVLNSNVGGSGKGTLPGFSDGTGAWNGGLRVTVVGRVTNVQPGYCCVDDGSRAGDGGLRVLLLPGVALPGMDSYIRATGISTWFDNGGMPAPAVAVGVAGDITGLTTE